MIHPLIDQALFIGRGLNLAAVCAVAIACQLLAIIYFVERLKGVDHGEGKTLAFTRERRLQERRERAGYGLVIDLSLYLLAAEIVAAFVVLGR